MHYDAIIYTTKKRWEPLKHAAVKTSGGWVSLCGRLDQRLWIKAQLGIVVCSKWLHDATCPLCVSKLRSAPAGTKESARG